MCVTDLRRVLHALGEVRELRSQPLLQRRCAIGAIYNLAGDGTRAAERLGSLTAGQWVTWLDERSGGSARKRHVERLCMWLGAEAGDGRSLPSPGPRHRTSRLGDEGDGRGGGLRRAEALRLFIVELSRLHRQGLLAPMTDAHDLTPRRRQVLERLLCGQRTRQIAGELAVGRRTVEDHVQGLCRQFGVRDRVALMARFLRREIEPRSAFGGHGPG